MSRVTGIRHWSSADSSTVVLDLEDQVQYEAHRLSAPDRIYFDLHDTTLSAEFDGKTIDNLYDFTYALRQHKPGDKVTVRVLRGGTQVVANVVLAKRN